MTRFGARAHATAWRRGFVFVLLGAGALGCTAEKVASQTAVPVGSATPSAVDDKPGAHDGIVASPSALQARSGYGAESAPAAPPPPAKGAPFGVPGAQAALVPTSAPADVPHLDPNGRYATTYRPGSAALAAFDAAVARGSIPAADRDLVGDFAARYAPALAKPKTGAMAFAVDTERTAVGPNGGDVNLRIAMRSSDATPGRAPVGPRRARRERIDGRVGDRERAQRGRVARRAPRRQRRFFRW